MWNIILFVHYAILWTNKMMIVCVCRSRMSICAVPFTFTSNQSNNVWCVEKRLPVNSNFVHIVQAVPSQCDVNR